MSNGKQIGSLALVIVVITAVATISGCGESLCRDASGAPIECSDGPSVDCFDPITGAPTGYCGGDAGVPPVVDSGSNPDCFDRVTGQPTGQCAIDSGVITCPAIGCPQGQQQNAECVCVPTPNVPFALVVEGQVDGSWGVVTAIEMVSDDLGTILDASCTMTAAGNNQTNFVCESVSAPSDYNFLIRFTANGSKFAAVTNYPGSVATDTCDYAHGVFINEVLLNGVNTTFGLFDSRPGVADPGNDCRQCFDPIYFDY